MRTFALLLLVVASAKAANTSLRGNNNRRLKVCEAKDSPYWEAFAINNKLNPIDGAAALYDACVADALEESGVKTGKVQARCFPPTTVFMYKAFMPAEKKECTSNQDCAAQSGVCWFKYGQSSCSPLGVEFQPECGSVVVKDDISLGLGSSAPILEEPSDQGQVAVGAEDPGMAP